MGVNEYWWIMMFQTDKANGKSVEIIFQSLRFIEFSLYEKKL
jgi:hypothetical protein